MALSQGHMPDAPSEQDLGLSGSFFKVTGLGGYLLGALLGGSPVPPPFPRAHSSSRRSHCQDPVAWIALNCPLLH